MAHSVFISYSHKDKPIADAICSNLENAGIRCWIAPRDIAPGLDWPTAISNAIAASRIMVLVFSANSNSSSDVSRELILAANNNLIIIPFRIDELAPEPGKQYYLARTHWLDAMNPPTQEQIDKLVGYVKSFIVENGKVGSVQPSQVTKRFDKEPAPTISTENMPIRKSRAGRWIAGMLALLILFGAIGILLWSQRANFPFLSRPVTTKTPIATSTSSRTFTPTPSPTITPSPTLTPIPPTPTPTPTGTPDLREENPGNQHLYLLVETPQFWHDARDTCASWGGHLATIQDYNENAFVYRLSSRVPYGTWPWLGATDEVQDGVWVWVTGEPWSWTIWDHIYDPQGIRSSNTENYLTFSDHQNLEWSYLGDGAAPFICEWEIPSP